MWDFLRMVYQGNNGGFGILIAFLCICECITRVAIAIVKRSKGVS